MIHSNTDKDWEKFGKDDPYYGVVSIDKFHKSNLTDEHKEEFFLSGATYINDVLEKVRKHMYPDFKINKAVDFGCGVGRLVIPLSDVSKEVLGIDVSDSMLKEAKKNCEARSIDNVVFTKSDDNLSSLEGKYDFIHSYIVFQHIPVKRGVKIFKQLLNHLEHNGVGVLHFTYAKIEAKQKLSYVLKKYIPFFKEFVNLVKGRKVSTPHMQMNMYNLNELFYILQSADVVNCYSEFTNHGGELGVMLYFQMP